MGCVVMQRREGMMPVGMVWDGIVHQLQCCVSGVHVKRVSTSEGLATIGVEDAVRARGVRGW